MTDLLPVDSTGKNNVTRHASTRASRRHLSLASVLTLALGASVGVAGAACGSHPAPTAPTQSTVVASASASAPDFLADPNGCGREAKPLECTHVCRAPEITEAVAASLCVKEDRTQLVLEFPSKTKQEQLAGLSRVPWLRKLRLKGAGITDLTPLASLTDLESLDLVSTGVTDLKPLAGLKKLKHLSITTGSSLVDPWPGKPRASAKQEDAEKAAQADAPRTEAPAGSDPEDMDDLVPKSSKTDLDLSPLAQVTGLRELRISGIAVTGKLLASMTQVETLELVRTKIDDPAALTGMTALHELLLVKVFVPSYDFLGTLTKLDELEVAKGRLSDIAFVTKIKALRRLVVSENPGLSSISPLKGSTTLEALDVDDTGVSDLAPLSGSPKLYFLDVQGTPVKSIAPLAKTPALRVVNLRRTQVKDITPLNGAESLKSVHLPEGAPPAQVEALKKARPSASLMSY